MPSTGRERQERWRQRQRAAGFTTVTLVVPTDAVADVKLLVEGLRAMNGLCVVPVLRSAGRFISVKSLLRAVSGRNSPP